MADTAPNMFFGAPRVWEMIHQGVIAKLGSQDVLDKMLADDREGTQNLIRAGLGLNDYDFLLTAAAPIPASLIRWYDSLGITLCEGFGQTEAMGLVVNHPMDVRVDEILEQLSLATNGHPHNEPVLAGGPLHTERGFVLHGNDQLRHWQDSVAVSDDIQLTTSLDILGDIACDSGPRHVLVALGYAGWAPGQLESELEENVWLTVPADPHLLFEVPHHKKLEAALKKLGIDLGRLAPYSGHA